MNPNKKLDIGQLSEEELKALLTDIARNAQDHSDHKPEEKLQKMLNRINEALQKILAS
jgi:polyhydroxyalkanoate synthesis regulator phasin